MTNIGSHLITVLVALLIGLPALADDGPMEANTPTYRAGDAADSVIKRSKPFKTKKKKKTSKHKAKLLKPKFKTRKKANKNKEELPAPMPKDAN